MWRRKRERERECAVQCMQNRSAESVCELWRQFEIFPIRISKARIHANSIGASVNDDRYTIFHHMTFFHSTLFTSIASYWNTAAVVTIAGNQFFHCLDWSLSTVTKFISNLNLIKKLEIEFNQPKKKSNRITVTSEANLMHKYYMLIMNRFSFSVPIGQQPHSNTKN